MEASTLSVPEPVLGRLRRSGFSLVEVTLAIGVVSFAFVAIFGLLPVGYNVFRHSMDISVGSQISQQVVSELQLTDFPEVIKNADGGPITNKGLKAIRYFDDTGAEVLNIIPGQSIPNSVLYFVNTRIVPATALLKAQAADPNNTNLATITVQVAANPSRRTLGYAPVTDDTDPQYFLWNGSFDSNKTLVGRVQIQTFTTTIAGNSNQL